METKEFQRWSRAAECALGNRSDERLLWSSAGVPSDRDHRLLRSDDRRLATVAVGGCPDRRGQAGGRAARIGGSSTAMRRSPCDPTTTGVRREGLCERRAPLRARGVHYAVLARAERHDSAVLPDLEGRVPLASPLHRAHEAFLVIAAWPEKYHPERPHSALSYLTPRKIGRASC